MSARLSGRDSVNRTVDRAVRLGLGILKSVSWCASATPQSLHSDETGAGASTPRNATELLRQVDLLVQQNAELEKQNQALISEIGTLRKALAKQIDETAIKEPLETTETGSNSIVSDDELTERKPSTAPQSG